MPLALTKTDICNGALQLLGQGAITDLDTDTSEEGDHCRIAYLRTRNTLLEEFRPRFATRTEALTALATATNPLFTYSYQLPDDFIHLLETDADETTHSYEVEGQVIVTDTGSLIAKFIYEEDNVGLYSAGFIRSLEYKLAARMAFGLTKDKVLTRDIAEIAESVTAIEKAKDAQQSGNQSYIINALTSVRMEGS